MISDATPANMCFFLVHAVHVSAGGRFRIDVDSDVVLRHTSERREAQRVFYISGNVAAGGLGAYLVCFGFWTSC